MAWITVMQLRNRLPLEGEGVEDAEIEEAIASAIEEVTGVCGSGASTSELCMSAVANYVHADVLDIIYPRDARERDSEAAVRRAVAERKVLRYLEIQQSDQDPSTADVPPVIITQSGPATVQIPDERY